MTDATKHASDIEDATPLYHWTEAQILALASAVSDLNGLADVSIEGPVEGDLLVYDDLTEDWLNMSAGVAGLSEVGHQHVEDDITDLGSYAALVHLHAESDISDFGTYSEVGHQHVEADITDLATDDHDHSGDVGDGGQLDWDNIWSDAVHDHSSDAEGGIFDAAILGSSTASDGYVLTADGLGGAAWEELTPGASALDDLADVNAPAPNNDDILTWDGAEWIAAALSVGASALSDLTDVNVTSPNDGDVLTWLTNEWVAAAAAGGAGDASDLTFTPSTVSDWDDSTDPGNADSAFDQIAERLSWLEAISEEWDRYAANAAALAVGTTSSVVSDLQTGNDGVFYSVTEAAASTAINLIVDFENITEFNYVHIKGVYDGSATHSVAIQLYNWAETRWDTYDALQTAQEDVSTADGYIYEDHSFLVFDKADYIGTGGDLGNVRLRFYHTMSGNPAHDMHIDLAELVFIPQFSAEAALSVTRQTIFTVSGALTVASSPLRIYNKLGANQTISEVFIVASTAPVGAAILVDVNLDGTTIFTNQAHRPTIADGANTGTTTDVDVATWTDDSYLTIDVDQIGSGTAGADLVVHIIHS